MVPLRNNDKPGFLCIITARGGSKSIPKKNIALVGGKPLIAWTIQTALRSSALSRVIVSTDDKEIAEVARKWGAETPFLRPAELAQDNSPHIPVVVQAIQWLESHESAKPDFILLLQPTLPLRTTEDIDNAIQLMFEKDADCIVSICEASSHPYLTKRITPDGRLQDFVKTPEGYLSRQTLRSAYSLNGAIYLARRDVFINKQTFYTDNTYAYIMPPERSLDIDTPWDLYLADLILRDRPEYEMD